MAGHRHPGAPETAWDQRYASAGAIPEPACVLRDNLHLLPAHGRALDLACGLGANALLLAGQGRDVTAWDLSGVAVTRLQKAAAQMKVRVDAQVRDLCAGPPEPATFDCILVANFLDRGLATAIAEALRPGGLLFYQTFGLESVSGPSNLAYRLGTNELLRLFPGLTLRFYREEGRLGDLTRGTRDLVQLVAQRPPAAA